ncbi:hypothetical protein IFR05_012177 [Cadophora sp. M221]|nr:hypothetical protein IFR05_012177 [Cadophora sp. M221]
MFRRYRRIDIGVLKVKQPASSEELNVLQANCDSEVKDHVIKKKDWQENNVQIEAIAFRGGNDDSSSESDDDNDLEERTRLLQENLNLLIQRKNIKKLSSKIKEKQADLEKSVQSLSEAESVVSALEPNARGLALALEKVTIALQIPELAKAQDTTKKIEQLNSEVEDQKAINRQQQKITPLLLSPPLLQIPKEDTNKTVAENMQAAYGEGRKVQYREMAGPYEAGCAI